MSSTSSEQTEARNFWEAASVVRSLAGRRSLSDDEADSLADSVAELQGIVANTDNWSLKLRAKEVLSLADSVTARTTAGSVA